MALFLACSRQSVCSCVGVSHTAIQAWEGCGTHLQGFYEHILQVASSPVHALWHHNSVLSGAWLRTLQVIFHVTIQNKSLEFPSTVPEELSNIGAKCMSKDPAERPTMKEVVETLEKLEPTE